MKRSRIVFGFSLVLAITWPAVATVPLDGWFIAGQDCPAYSSIKKKKNPGDIRLLPKQAYEVVGKNKSAASHYLLRLEVAAPSDRWVAVSCGMLLTDCNSSGKLGDTMSTGGGNGEGQGGTVATGGHLLLAVSWQPAFCQTHQSKDECETQTGERFDATHLALHGLWPQPRGNEYCAVSNLNKRLDQNKAWSQLPRLNLTDSTRADLAVTMPGVASFLQRHEWYKHGSCYGPPEEYFKDSLILMDQLNASKVRELFADNIGQRVSAQQIRDSFDQSFGDGSGEKVQVKCNGGMISELYINLRGEIAPDTELGNLLAAGAGTGPRCQHGRVDPAGF